jgi:hypothetical protein
MATLVQTASNTVAGNFSLSATFGSNVTAGDLIFVVVVDLDNGAGIGTLTLTDSLGNTYTQIQNQQLSTQINWSCWYAKSIAGGACTVTFEDHNGNTFLHGITMVCAEFSGLSATAPLVSEQQFFQSSGGGGTGTFTLPDSNAVDWTVSYTLRGGDTGYGAVDLTGAGVDLLLFYQSFTPTSNQPVTTSPVSGTFNQIVAQSGTSYVPDLALWQFNGTIPVKRRRRPYCYLIT